MQLLAYCQQEIIEKNSMLSRAQEKKRLNIIHVFKKESNE